MCVSPSERHPETSNIDKGLKKTINSTKKIRHVHHSLGLLVADVLAKNNQPNRKSIVTQQMSLKRRFLQLDAVQNLSLPVTVALFISLTDCHVQPHNSLTKGHTLLSMSSLQCS